MTNQKSINHSTIEKVNPWRAVGIGLLAAGLMFTVGLFLVFTVIGAVIGIPLIIISFWIPIVGPFLVRQASCPICNERLTFNMMNKGFTCRYCKHRLVRKDNELYGY